jgi:hypothetical protein
MLNGYNQRLLSLTYGRQVVDKEACRQRLSDNGQGAR